mmetsp:Transcript_196/g.204  ORF Transcript_196/g.204 Transcript_196/m.204 type:complete len:468 (-) Transcript_196:8-1411(-)
MKYCVFLLSIASLVSTIDGFSVNSFFNGRHSQQLIRTTNSHRSSSVDENVDSLSQEEVQWNLFNKYHARGNWRGTWTSYNFMGDVIDTTTGSVNLNTDQDANDLVTHEHEVVIGSIKSDCENCFDSMETKIFPVTTYTPDNLSGRNRCASCAMVSGPSLLRSGAMSTELILAFGDGRVRVTFQHAPVWESSDDDDDENNPQQTNGPPDGLKLFRIMVAREVLGDAPPSPSRDSSVQPGNPTFFRPVPPFKWHNEWAGTTWTWGPQAGDRGWAIEEMDEADSWHGRPTGDNQNVWSLRLGGILLQCPRVVMPNTVDFCRLAWLPEEETDEVDAKLIRIEAGITAMEPVIDEESDMLVGFMPPKLSNLRCDVMTKSGELENASMLEQLKKLGELNVDADSKSSSDNKKESVITKPATNESTKEQIKKEDKSEEKVAPENNSKPSSSTMKKGDDNEGDDGDDKLRNMLSL